jgi:hypothetical protein
MQVAPSPNTALGMGEEKWALPKEFSAVRLKAVSEHIHRPEVEVMAEEKPDYTRVELRKSVRNLAEAAAKADEEKKHKLSAEFDAVQLKSSSHHRKAEVEVMAEEKPDYTKVELQKSVRNLDEAAAKANEEKRHKLSAEFDAVQLKSSSHHRKAEVEVMAEEKPDYRGVELRKSVKNLDEVSARADEEKKHKLSAEFDAVQLKSSSHHRKAEVEVMAEEKPDYTKVELQKSVRNLDEAAAKANEEKRHKLSAEFDAVQLKSSSHHRKAEVEVMAEEKPDYRGVELRKSVKNLDEVSARADEEKKHKLSAEFDAVQLKSSSHHRKAEVEVLAEEKPDYTATKLKPAPVKSKEEMEAQKAAQRPSFAGVELRKSVRPLDEATAKADDDNKHRLSGEFDTVQLKSLSRHGKAEVEVLLEEKPDYTAVQLTSALQKAPKAPVVEEAAPLYAAVSLKSTGQAYAMKSGGDVKLEAVEKEKEAPVFAAVSLRKSVVMEKAITLDDSSKYNLPQEFSAVQLKKSEPKPEIELPPEEKPEYSAVQLKHAAIKTKEPVAAEAAPSYTALSMKNAGYGDAVKSGRDVKKEAVEKEKEAPVFSAVSLRKSVVMEKAVSLDDSSKYNLPQEFSAVQLKKSEPKPEIELPPEEKPKYSAVQLKRAEIKPKEPATEEAAPLYAAVSLKNTGQADVIKSGGDVKKDVVEKDEEAPVFAAVSLRKSVFMEKPISLDDSSKYNLPQEFSAVQRKKSEPKPEIELPPEEKPAYSAVQLKHAAVKIKEPVAAEAAPTYTAVSMKNTGYGDAIKSRGDAKKEAVKKLAEPKPTYSAVPLKNRGHRDAVKSSGGIKKEVQEDPNKYALPVEFNAVQLKKAEPIVKSKEDIPEEKPEYLAVQLKHAEIKPKEPATEEAAPSYAAVHLKSTGQADAIKSGCDVKKEAVEKEKEAPVFSAVSLKKSVVTEKPITLDDSSKYNLPQEFSAVQLKKSEPKPEIELPPEEKPQYSAVQKKRAEVKPWEPLLDEEAQHPSYATVSLKNTGQADVIKRGGDVKKEAVEKEKEAPFFAAVNLRKSVIMEKPITLVDSSKYNLPQEFSAVQLKKKSEPKPEVELPPEEKPAYAEMHLKAAAPVQKQKREQRSSYGEVQLKATGSADIIKSGKDVQGRKIEKSFDLPDVFTGVQLKKPVARKSELED